MYVFMSNDIWDGFNQITNLTIMKDIELSIVLLTLTTVSLNRPTRLLLTMSFLKYGLSHFTFTYNLIIKRL
jgi:hypothetical protein